MATARRARVVGSRRLNPTVREVTFEMVDPPELPYEPGKYIILHTVPVGEKILKRAYSIASPPFNPRRLTFTVKVIPEGISSPFVDSLAVGQEVEFSGPWGKFLMPPGNEKPLLFAATGTGFSCAHAHIAWELAQGNPRPIEFLWGLRREEDAYYADELDRLAAEHSNFAHTLTLSRPSDGWGGRRGRVTEVLRERAAEFRDRLVFLSGNGAMVEDAEAILLAAGVPPEAIRKEPFFKPKGPAGGAP